VCVCGFDAFMGVGIGRAGGRGDGRPEGDV